MKKPVWRETEAFRPYSYIVDHIAKKSINAENVVQKLSQEIFIMKRK